MFFHRSKYSVLYKTIALAVACLFLVNDISWALDVIASPVPVAPKAAPVQGEAISKTTTLAAQSRLKPFFENNGLDFKDMAGVICAAGRLRKLLINQTSSDNVKIRREIIKMNRLFPDGAVKIEEETQSRDLGGKECNYAVFHFAKASNPINVFFIKDHAKLTPDELKELGIEDKDKHHLDCPGLEGVWFVNTNRQNGSNTDKEIQIMKRRLPLLTRLLSSTQDSKDTYGYPRERVESEIWNVLRQIYAYRYEIEKKAPNPYLEPEQYLNHILDLFYQFWHLMQRDGRYRDLVKYGLKACVEKHIRNLKKNRFYTPACGVRKEYAQELASMIKVSYEDIFKVYDDIAVADDFEHHLPGWGFEDYGDYYHEGNFGREELRRTYGVEFEFGPVRRGLQREINCMEDEAALYRKWTTEFTSGKSDLNPDFDVEREVAAAHVLYNDSVRTKVVMNPDTPSVFGWSNDDLESRGRFDVHVENYRPAIQKYLERRLKGSPSILEIGAGAGTLGHILANSRLKANLHGIEWNKNAVKRAHLDGKGEYVEKGSVYSIPYPDNSVDAVISLEAQDTFEDQERALREICRVLKHGGIFIHIAILWPNLEVLTKLYEAKGVQLFSEHTMACVKWIEHKFYFENEKDAQKYLKLNEELAAINRNDAENAGIKFENWPSTPQESITKNGIIHRWSDEALKKKDEINELIGTHARLLKKDAFRNMLIEKARGLFSFEGERVVKDINFYSFIKILNDSEANLDTVSNAITDVFQNGKPSRLSSSGAQEGNKPAKILKSATPPPGSYSSTIVAQDEKLSQSKDITDRDQTFTFELELLARKQVRLLYGDELSALAYGEPFHTGYQRVFLDVHARHQIISFLNGRTRALPKGIWTEYRNRYVALLKKSIPKSWVVEVEKHSDIIEIKTTKRGFYRNIDDDWNELCTSLARLQKEALPYGFVSIHLHVSRESLVRVDFMKDKLNINPHRLMRLVKTFEAMWMVLGGFFWSARPKRTYGEWYLAIWQNPISLITAKEADAHDKIINKSSAYPTIEFKHFNGLLNEEHKLNLGTLRNDVRWCFRLLDIAAEKDERLPLAELGLPALSGAKPSQKQIDRFLDIMFSGDRDGRELAERRFAAAMDSENSGDETTLQTERKIIENAFKQYGLDVIYGLHRAGDGYDSDIVENTHKVVDQLAMDLKSSGLALEEILGFFPKELHKLLAYKLSSVPKYSITGPKYGKIPLIKMAIREMLEKKVVESSCVFMLILVGSCLIIPALFRSTVLSDVSITLGAASGLFFVLACVILVITIAKQIGEIFNSSPQTVSIPEPEHIGNSKTVEMTGGDPKNVAQVAVRDSSVETNTNGSSPEIHPDGEMREESERLSSSGAASVTMGVREPAFSGELFRNPAANEGEVPKPVMRSDLLEGPDLVGVQPQRDEFLFRFNELYLGWFELMHEFCYAMGIPKPALLLQGSEFWYLSFHKLLPPFIKPAFGIGHGARSNHLSLALSKTFEYYGQISSTFRLPQRVVSIVSGFQDKWAHYETGLLDFRRFNAVPGDMLNSIPVPFDMANSQIPTSITSTSIARDTKDVKGKFNARLSSSGAQEKPEISAAAQSRPSLTSIGARSNRWPIEAKKGLRNKRRITEEALKYLEDPAWQKPKQPPLVISTEAAEKIAALDRLFIKYGGNFELSCHGFTKRQNDGNTVLIDVVLPKEDKILRVDHGMLVGVQPSSYYFFSAAFFGSKHLVLDSQDGKIKVVSDKKRLSFDLDERDWNELKALFVKLAHRELPDNMGEMEAQLKNQGALELDLDWEMVIMSNQGIKRVSYLNRALRIAKDNKAELNFELHYHPGLYGGERSQYLGFSTGDLFEYAKSNVTWAQIRTPAELDKGDDTVFLHRLHHIDSVVEALGPTVFHVVPYFYNNKFLKVFYERYSWAYSVWWDAVRVFDPEYTTIVQKALIRQANEHVASLDDREIIGRCEELVRRYCEHRRIPFPKSNNDWQEILADRFAFYISNYIFIAEEIDKGFRDTAFDYLEDLLMLLRYTAVKLSELKELSLDEDTTNTQKNIVGSQAQFRDLIESYLSNQDNAKKEIDKAVGFIGRSSTTPTMLEIGCGSTRDALAIARAYPNINIIAFDVYDINSGEYAPWNDAWKNRQLEAQKNPVDNLVILRADMNDIIKILPTGSIDTMLLIKPDDYSKDSPVDLIVNRISGKDEGLIGKLKDGGQIIIKPFIGWPIDLAEQALSVGFHEDKKIKHCPDLANLLPQGSNPVYERVYVWTKGDASEGVATDAAAETSTAAKEEPINKDTHNAVHSTQDENTRLSSSGAQGTESGEALPDVLLRALGSGANKEEFEAARTALEAASKEEKAENFGYVHYATHSHDPVVRSRAESLLPIVSVNGGGKSVSHRVEVAMDIHSTAANLLIRKLGSLSGSDFDTAKHEIRSRAHTDKSEIVGFITGALYDRDKRCVVRAAEIYLELEKSNMAPATKALVNLVGDEDVGKDAKRLLKRTFKEAATPVAVYLIRGLVDENMKNKIMNFLLELAQERAEPIIRELIRVPLRDEALIKPADETIHSIYEIAGQLVVRCLVEALTDLRLQKRAGGLLLELYQSHNRDKSFIISKLWRTILAERSAKPEIAVLMKIAGLSPKDLSIVCSFIELKKYSERISRASQSARELAKTLQSIDTNVPRQRLSSSGAREKPEIGVMVSHMSSPDLPTFISNEGTVANALRYMVEHEHYRGNEITLDQLQNRNEKQLLGKRAVHYELSGTTGLRALDLVGRNEKGFYLKGRLSDAKLARICGIPELNHKTLYDSNTKKRCGIERVSEIKREIGRITGKIREGKIEDTFKLVKNGCSVQLNWPRVPTIAQWRKFLKLYNYKIRHEFALYRINGAWYFIRGIQGNGKRRAHVNPYSAVMDVNEVEIDIHHHPYSTGIDRYGRDSRYPSDEDRNNLKKGKIAFIYFDHVFYLYDNLGAIYHPRFIVSGAFRSALERIDKKLTEGKTITPRMLASFGISPTSNSDGYNRRQLLRQSNLLEDARTQNKKMAFSAKAAKIHAKNIKVMPAIPKKTILCHIIAESILPEGQRNMLNKLEVDMRDESYAEKIVSLSAESPDKFVEELSALMEKQRKFYEGYTVQFDVACPNTELVRAILESNLGVKALAFEPCRSSDADVAQVEGIILALRALGSNKIETLREAYRLLAGKELTQELSGITDINEFIKRITFVLPAARIMNYNHIRQLNEIIRKNIEVAA